MFPSVGGWAARVRRAGWAGVLLEVDGEFAGEAEALAWCERMANVLARDAEDDAKQG
jgi:hypothetical protein